MLTTVEKVLFLNKIELFNASTPAVLVYLARIAEEKVFDKGETILSEGVIVEGEVNLIRNNVVVAVLVADEIIGTWALFEEESWPYAADAKNRVTVLIIQREKFYDLLDDYPEISQGLFKSLSRKIRTLVVQLDDGTKTIDKQDQNDTST